MNQIQARAHQNGRPDGRRQRLVGPVGVRKSLEQLGPTFVKLGQYLSLRPDVVPQDYCDELLKLLDAAPPSSFAASRRIFQADVGDLGRFFSWIDPQPIGAASLAQVYRARTHAGREVAIKIQRPGVEERVRRDLRRIRLLSRIIEQMDLAPGVSVPEVVDELSRWMHEELDLRRELRNLMQLHELSRRAVWARIPRAYPELSGRRVVTMDRLDGVPFSQLLRLIRAGRPDRIAQLGFDREALAENLIETILEQIFRFERFHADTHPGNLIALPGNLIGFVDFGLVDTMDPVVRGGMLRYLRAGYAGDLQGVLHGLLEILVRTDRADPDGFRADFLEETRRWRREQAGQSTGRSPEDGSPIARYLIGVLRAARRNGMLVPPGVLSMYRSLLTAETVAHQLGGRADLASVGRRFFSRLEVENLGSMLGPESVGRQLLQLAEVVTMSPATVQRLLSDLANDRFVLQVETAESRESRRQANARVRLIAVAVLSVGVALLLVGSSGDVLFGVRLSDLLWGVLAGVYLWLFFLWRRL